MKEHICKICIMDTSDPDISFYSNQGCNNCKNARKKLKALEEKRKHYNNIINDIKRKGKNKKYNCVIGVSGGVDSSYVAYLVKKAGLRPLAVHLDNGWNSELAIQNIENLLKILNIDYYHYIVNWEEFRDIQLAFLKASTPDSEIPSDHAIVSLLYLIADKFNISYIIDGINLNSESILPPKWSSGHDDWKYIKNIHRKYGSKHLYSYPYYNRWDKIYYNKIKRIHTFSILNYINYNKENAKKLLQEKLGWIDYGGKHYESFYTKFYQAYILPTKFGYDKRRMHLSSLIVSGQMTREEALKEIEKPLYKKDDLKDDMTYFLKKMKISELEFKMIMEADKKQYMDYPNYKSDFIYRYLGI